MRKPNLSNPILVRSHFKLVKIPKVYSRIKGQKRLNFYSKTFLLTFYRAERKAYIKAKYEDKKFVELFCANSQEVLLELEAAIEEHSLYDVLRCLCEAAHHGVDLTDPLPSSVSFIYKGLLLFSMAFILGPLSFVE